MNTIQPKKKRKYYRHCGFCNARFEQSFGYRTNKSPNGWLCKDCQEKQEENIWDYMNEFEERKY